MVWLDSSKRSKTLRRLSDINKGKQTEPNNDLFTDLDPKKIVKGAKYMSWKFFRDFMS